MKNKLNNAILFICFVMSLFYLPKPSFAFVPIGSECSTADQCDDGLFCNGREGCARDDSRGGIKVCYRSLGPFHSVPSVRFRGGPQTEPQSICESDSNPYTRDYCNEGTRSCVHEAEDVDGDGHASIRTGGDDCDDNDPNAFPGNTEVCDNHQHNEDCDPTTGGGNDNDADGYVDGKCFNRDEGGFPHWGVTRH